MKKGKPALVVLSLAMMLSLCSCSKAALMWEKATDEAPGYTTERPDPTAEASDESEFTVSEVIDDNEFLMPNLVGMSWEEANRKYSEYIKLKAEQEWSDIAEGQIFDQEFVEGRKVRVGTEVTVKVSKGIRRVEIQDLENLSVDIAQTKLEKDGFVVRKSYVESDDVPKDMVIRTEPAAHEMADQGSTVVLVVSLGADGTQVEVPWFIGMSLSDAIQSADECNLRYVVESRYSDEYAEGVVMEQSVEPYTKVDCDAEIILTVSKGSSARMTKSLKYTLPKKAQGEFLFKYYVDGVWDDNADVLIDIGLASNKSMKYDVEGMRGETKKVTIRVTSVETGKTGTYMEITVTFPEDDGNPIAEEEFNSSIFTELTE